MCAKNAVVGKKAGKRMESSWCLQYSTRLRAIRPNNRGLIVGKEKRGLFLSSKLSTSAVGIPFFLVMTTWSYWRLQRLDRETDDSKLFTEVNSECRCTSTAAVWLHGVHRENLIYKKLLINDPSGRTG